MSNTDKKLTFDSFPTTDKEAWKQKIITDLKGKDYEESLVWQTKEGFAVQPFYDKSYIGETEKNLSVIQNSLLNTENPDFGYRYWSNTQKIEVSDPETANKMALNALQNGAEGLLFYLPLALSTEELNQLLHDIQLNFCRVSFHVKGLPEQLLKNYNKLIQENNIDITAINGELLCDFTEADENTLNDIFDLLDVMPHFKLQLSVGSTAATYSAETADILAEAVNLVEVLEKFGKTPVQVLTCLSVGIHLRHNYFFEIARLRALRFLFSAMANSYGITYQPADLHIHTITSIEVNEATKEDPYLNMLSNTGQAMAGIIGGCNSLTVLPHNEGIEQTDNFSIHIARNVSSILKEEAYFDKVADPAAGSYYLENLTTQLAAKSWELFQELV
jgi:methylmalonyl-CoA mutase